MGHTCGSTGGVEPTPEHLLAVPVALDARGVGAWLVAVSGDYWFDEEVEAQAVRLLTRRAPSAEAVVEAFRRRRIATLSSVAKAGGVEPDATDRTGRRVPRRPSTA
jgi:hypothetical protein